MSIDSRAGRRGQMKWLLVGFFLVLLANAAYAASSQEGERRVRRDIDRFVRARLASTDADAGKISIDIPPLVTFGIDRDRYPGKLRTEITTRAPEPLRGRAPLAVALYAGDKLVKRSVVTPNIRRTERVIVPTRDLRVGTVLSPTDFVLVDRDVSRLPRDVVRDTEEVIGLRAKRSLRKDRVIRSSQVEGIPLVERGDRVQLVLEAGPLQIHATGRAQEKGAMGDWIRVLNVDSKRELSGRLDRDGRVHVAF